MGRFHFACRKCVRRGRYSAQTLKAQFGPLDITQLPHAVAQWRQCPMFEAKDARGRPMCGIYLDLAAWVMADKAARQGRGRR
jgi:hypothetical protein